MINSVNCALDASSSRISFRVKHLLVATVEGRFSRASGCATFDVDDLARSTFEGRVEAESVHTEEATRDEYLRTNALLDPVRYPEIVASNGRVLRMRGERAQIGVDLTVRGTTRQLLLDAEPPFLGVGSERKRRARVMASGELSRKDFGREFDAAWGAGDASIGDRVNVDIDAHINPEASVVTSLGEASNTTLPLWM